MHRRHSNASRTADTVMSLAPFTYALPILLGYTLFAGVSGRLDPISLPGRVSDRPSWALGLWVGSVVVVTATLALHAMRTAPPESARDLLTPGLWALAAALLPAALVWLAGREALAHRRENEALRHRGRSLLDVRPEDFPAAARDAAAIPARPAVLEDAQTHPLIATFLGVGGPERLDIPDIPVARVDADPSPEATGDVVAREAHEIALGAAEDESALLCEALRQEEALREETERHLRIIRRALAKLEAESSADESQRTEVLIALEEELERRVRESATADARATRETARRIEAENTIGTLKRRVLMARREARRGTELRAKALSAANRSIALTRQAIRARAQLERQLRRSEARLAERETTLASVIRALEKEKGRTREEVGTLARQLVQHEKQLRARRDLEEVARSVEGKLTRRLARKVARARPLAPSS